MHNSINMIDVHNFITDFETRTANHIAVTQEEITRYKKYMEI